LSRRVIESGFHRQFDITVTPRCRPICCSNDSR
jgi:hypothetical protein